MWRPLIHQTTCANTFIRMGLFFPTNNSALEEVQEQRLTGQKTESWVGATLDWKFACKMGTVCRREKNKATTSWGILVNSFQINCTFVCRLRMENILQQSWRRRNTFWSSKQEATVCPAPFLHSIGCETFKWKLRCRGRVHRASIHSGQHSRLGLVSVRPLTAGQEESKQTRARRPLPPL